MERNNKDIKQAFWKYSLSEKIRQSNYVCLLAGVLILFFMIYDWFIMDRTITVSLFSLSLFLTFLIPLLNKVLPKYKKITSIIYDILLLSVILGQFGILLYFFRTDSYFSEVISLFFIIFAVAFENNERAYRIALVNGIPLVFFLIIFFSLSPTTSEIYDLFYIIPMFIAAFIGNRFQYRQKFQTFKYNYLLSLEKKKAEQLYDESLILNEELEISNRNYIDTLSVKNKFFSIISHDLRSPFGVILGFSDILSRNHQNFSKEKTTEYLDLINHSAIHTFELLEDLLQWAQVQQGTIQFAPEIVFLNEFTENELSKIRNIADKKHITISQDIEISLNVYADTNMLRTVLRNLLSNAIKFTNTNGHIKIESFQKDACTIISISDNGVGIPKNTQKDIFDITVNTTSAGTENEKSSGLGLTLSKEFVEKHNGKIWFESEIGKGTTFFFSIPNKEINY